MIKEALEYIAHELSPGKVLTAAGIPYTRFPLTELPAPAASVEALRLHTLQGLVDYLTDSCLDNTEPEDEGPRHKVKGIVAESPCSVRLVSSLFGAFSQRDTLIHSTPVLGKPFPFGAYLDTETFVVSLLSKFVQDDTTKLVLAVVGNLVQEEGVVVQDDGVTQEVTVRRGVRRGLTVLPSPLSLRPFRTFQEIEQPASNYVLRVQKSNDGLPLVALFEVDDQLWSMKAVQAIKEYLDARLNGTPRVFV